MKKILLSLFILAVNLLRPIKTYAGQEKVVYGKSNLIDFYQIEDSTPHIKEWSRSVAAMVSKETLQKEGLYYLIKESKSNDEELPFCPPMTPLEKSFSYAQKLSDCTAFLIGPDILATALHCVEDETICKENVWVFDYKLENENKVFTMFPSF